MWLGKKTARSEPSGLLRSDAILQIVERTQAVIHFRPDGTILTANENFLNAVGYTEAEIVGQHHSMFVARELRETKDYETFWERLRSGDFFTDEFPRITKEGNVIWIAATYAPVFDEAGDVVQITKIAREITGQKEAIRAISDGLDALSQGDLTQRVTLQQEDRLREVADSFNAAVDNVSQLIRQVMHATVTIDGMSEQISANSGELSQRTKTQAATLEETAAAIEELSTTAQSAVDYATEVNRESQDTKAAAEGSGQVVDDVTAAMTRIEESSDAISTIISVIDDIAFQTNLLALNAGVEAARAGSAGRGFAVVAAEVQSLAQKSADSAQEIKDLISESGEHVRSGVTLVNRASTELGGIFSSVDRITERISEVVKGLEEQTVTLGEINTAISSLDEVTQHNAAMVNDTASVTQALSSHSASLSDGVSVFRIETLPEEKEELGSQPQVLAS
ncbi:PAS domain-containing methyl-accepting chemotaxis protein [Pacificoceanicola onchidii]|uniref:methyl-accepting chemotaxis protein n=1 Tax=Pacificoceanicola onchidii TaxID=2562685 RepID=UPI0010A3DF68|nr:PAS domain-containing methyl-accepting chemotaxis protein [Pacificoceanicola onchidii]